jgi:protein-tyrosine phosphatase
MNMKELADRTEVYPNLFIGSAPMVLPKGFDMIVFTALEYQPRFPETGQNLVYVGLDDAKPTLTERAWALRTAVVVADALERGKKVLVTCFAGRNRSAWVAAMAMRIMGMSARTVVSRIRSLRGDSALSNRHFVETLEAIR